MAKQLDFKPKAPDAREELERKLHNAPVEHVEAVLNAYRVLQQMHDSNTLDMIRGLLGAGDEVILQATSVITAPTSVRSIRNLLVLANMFGEINPEVLHSLVKSIEPLVKPKQVPQEPPSLFKIMRRMFSRDARMALNAGVMALEGIGKSMGNPGA